jgi:hypothetical protein
VRRRRGSRRVLGERRDDDSVDRRLTAKAEHERCEHVERQHDAYAGIGGDRQHFARGIARIDIDDDRARPQDPESRDDVLRTVGKHDADAVALHDPVICQGGRERVRSPLDIEKRELAAEKPGRGLVGDVDGGRIQNVRERPLGVRQVRPDPVVVMLKPRPRGAGRMSGHAIVRPPSTMIV